MGTPLRRRSLVVAATAPRRARAALTPRYPNVIFPLSRSAEVKPGDVISVKVDWCVHPRAGLRLWPAVASAGAPTHHNATSALTPPLRCRVMANELTLVGITDMWKKFEKPKVFNKERVWLAVDHTVDPRIVSIVLCDALRLGPHPLRRLCAQSKHQ
jgi:hypothetical protein